MKCRKCAGAVSTRYGWRAVTLRCTSCGTVYPLADYLDEIDDNTWERIARRSCDRT